MAKELRNLEEVRRFTDEKLEQWKSRNTFCFGVWPKQAKERIGQIQAKNIARDIAAAELGYFIASASQRNGYASESICAILRVAFEQLNFQRIFVRILPSNRESHALAKKLGFKGCIEMGSGAGLGSCTTCIIFR
jgi:ribosomal-protein-alanine N-acetyltransferase